MDIQKFVTTKEDGTFEINSSAFQSEFDAEISRAVETYKNGKGKQEIREQLEAEAKLTAEDKLKQERAEFENYVKTAKIELNVEKAKAKLEGKGFDKDELSVILSTINEDVKTLENIDKLVAARQKVLEQVKANAIQELQQSQQAADKKFDGNAVDESEPVVVKKSKDEILSMYRKNKN